MTKLLAIGDLHHGPNLEQIDAAIERERPDLTIFLGDYFDQFHDHFDHARRTAQWLKKSLATPNRIHLWGNHDIAYYASSFVHCKGYDPAKERAIRSVLDDDDWAKLKLWHLENGWLFTHAGLTEKWGPNGYEELPQYLQRQEELAWVALWSRQPHWIWARGKIRGGSAAAGGLLWCDWRFEFTPIPGLNQVMGHTPDDTLRIMRGTESENWCIDVSSLTGVTHILAIDDSGGRVVEV